MYTVAGPKCGGETSRRAPLLPIQPSERREKPEQIDCSNAEPVRLRRSTKPCRRWQDRSGAATQVDARRCTPAAYLALRMQGHAYLHDGLRMFFKLRNKPTHLSPKMHQLRPKQGGDTFRLAPLLPGRAFSQPSTRREACTDRLFQYCACFSNQGKNLYTASLR